VTISISAIVSRVSGAGLLATVVSLALPVTSAFAAQPAQKARAAQSAQKAGAAAQAAQPGQPPSLSEKTSEAMKEMKTLLDAKNWNGMIELLDRIIPTLDPESYDMAYIQDTKAKIYGQTEQYAKMLGPWETAFELNKKHKYFDEKWTSETGYFLAQLNYQEGLSSKVPATQQQYITKAVGFLREYLAKAKKPNADAPLLFASMLYNQAVAVPDKVDRNLIQQARVEVEKALTTTIKPKEGLYALLLAITQQESDFARGSELLELLVKLYPEKKDYWPLLMSFYLNLANTKDEDAARTNLIRAINTIERAQSFGHMKTPKDNYNLFSLYISASQYTRANELLYAGLKSGGIENDIKNWIALGYYYQQANQEMQAIAVLKEATGLFPQGGQLELQIGEIYRQLERNKEANTHYRTAVTKGGLEKPHVAYQLLSYSEFELENFDEAMKAVLKAESYPEGKKDPQLPRLKAGIQEAINERKAAQEAKQPKPAQSKKA